MPPYALFIPAAMAHTHVHGMNRTPPAPLDLRPHLCRVPVSPKRPKNGPISDCARPQRAGSRCIRFARSWSVAQRSRDADCFSQFYFTFKVLLYVVRGCALIQLHFQSYFLVPVATSRDARKYERMNFKAHDSRRRPGRAPHRTAVTS